MMRRLTYVTSVLALSVAVTGVLLAQERPDIKLGLWEMAIEMDMSAAMPGVDMSKVPPEQRAMVEAMMKGRGGAPMTVKTCMTKEKVAASKYTTDQPGQTCKETVHKSSATTVDITQTCTGNRPSTSEMHIEMVSPTSMKMTAKQTSADRPGAPVTVNMTSKWLSADCGDVK